MSRNSNTLPTIATEQELPNISTLTKNEKIELYDSFSSVFCHFDEVYIKQFSIFGAFHALYIGYIAQAGASLLQDKRIMISAVILIVSVSVFSIAIMVRNRSWLRRYQVAMDMIESEYLPLPRPTLIPTSIIMMIMILLFSVASAAITLYAGGHFGL